MRVLLLMNLIVRSNQKNNLALSVGEWVRSFGTVLLPFSPLLAAEYHILSHSFKIHGHIFD